MMNITLEQLKVLDVIATEGTFAKAAKRLRKSGPALVYALKTLEEQLGLTLLDRSAYRTRLTPEGEHILLKARELLAAEAALYGYARELGSGYEPELRIVYDGILWSE